MVKSQVVDFSDGRRRQVVFMKKIKPLCCQAQRVQLDTIWFYNVLCRVIQSQMHLLIQFFNENLQKFVSFSEQIFTLIDQDNFFSQQKLLSFALIWKILNWIISSLIHML